MKLVIVIACYFAVVLAAPKPEEYEDDRQQQLRRRLQGLRLRIAEAELPGNQELRTEDHYQDQEEQYLRSQDQRYDRHNDHEDEYLRSQDQRNDRYNDREDEYLRRQDHRSDRYYDRDEDYLRKIEPKTNPLILSLSKAHPTAYHDLGSLNFRYYSPPVPHIPSISNSHLASYISPNPYTHPALYHLSATKLKPHAVDSPKPQAPDSKPSFYPNYYRSLLREQEQQDREEDEDDQD